MTMEVGNQTLSSTTAPGKTFSSRSELAQHYKSDWHKYNLKRREAGLQLLQESDFLARWEAALALKKDKEGKAKNSGTDHIKAGGSSKAYKKHKNKPTAVTADISYKMDTTPAGTEAEVEIKTPAPKEIEPQEKPEINPKQSLFDNHTSDSHKANLKYMHQTYGFFIPDREHLRDLEGLLGYCHEKIKLGHYCLYCEQMFPTWSGCQKHMVDKQHTKLRYEKDYWEELDPFFDFKAEDAAFLGEATGVAADVKVDEVLSDSDDDEGDDVVMDADGDDEDWEDIGSDDEAVYSRYEKAMEAFGLDITPLGELVFPDGRIVGHRALRKYYKQRFRAENTSTAMVAAKTAAGERMYDGRVVQIGQPSEQSIRGAGKGVLVALKGTGAAGFTALSLYRYRAIVKKQRRDDNAGRINKNRTALPINKMDKKANRIMNGVSVAHAAR